MKHHGIHSPPGMYEHGVEHHEVEGRFARIFDDLPRLISTPEDLRTVGEPGGPMDQDAHGEIGHSHTPLGFVFLGQFIDHDVTLDVTSSFDRLNDPQAIRNFRTPTLDLDCIYGSGPEASPHLYYQAPESPTDRQRAISGHHLLTLESDLVRAFSAPEDNSRRAALIGDPRNDENRVISQLQLTMHYFHNAVFDHLLEQDCHGEEAFEEAQRLVRWHYQWIVLHDFLPRMVGEDLVEDILCNGRKVYHCDHGPFIPIEFAVAAYRFGHTMVTMKLDYNGDHQHVELFGDELGQGFSENDAGAIDWSHFFGDSAQNAGAVDIRLPSDLLALPFVDPGPRASLATRNLLRGQAFGLPSGQKVHERLCAICGEDLPTPDLKGLGLPSALAESTPLWLYILAEGSLSDGKHLGPVGGRLVAEVLIGLMECDRTAFLGSNRSWEPELVEAGETWDMEALIAYAGYGTT